ncbi:unnamed protein product, partial [Effrenium voratum]
RAAKSKAAAPDVPEVTEELYKRAHNALSYQIRKGGDSADQASETLRALREPGRRDAVLKSFAEHSAGTTLQWLHTFTQHTIFETSQSAEKRGQWFSRWQVAAAMGNPPDALVKKKLQVLRFRDAHDETLKAMGEPEYWWTMDSLVEAAAEKEAQSAVAHASHVVQPPSHQESMHTRTMKRLEGGIRRLNKLSASSLRLRARAPEDGALAKSLLDTETTISRLVFDHQKSLHRGEQDKDCTQWLAQQLADLSAAEKDIGDVLKHAEETLRPAPDAASEHEAFGSQHACMKRSHDDLLRVSPVGLNTAALARVLLFAKREPELLEALPEGQDTLRANLSRRHHALAAALTRQVACGSYEFPQLHLPAAVPYFRDNLPGWEQALDAWRGQSPQVADAVYYLDEIVPGNVLSRDNRRKFYAVYLGLRAFRALLHAETFWMPLAIWRAEEIKAVSGGVSALVAASLDALCNSYWPLDARHEQRLPLRIANLLADEAAIRALYASKGAAGWKPCLACANVCMKRSDISEARGAGLITICDSGPFASHTSETIWQMAD